MSEPISCVYALVDPADGRTYYVGQTSHLSNRISAHFGAGAYLPVKTWVRRLNKAKRRPRVVILARCSREALAPAERAWIRYHVARGEPLLNAQRLDPVRQLSFNWDPFELMTSICIECGGDYQSYRRVSWRTAQLVCARCQQPKRQDQEGSDHA